MKIIIVGLGQTGISIANQLAKESHDVIVIDNTKETVNYVTDHYSVSGICGSGVSKQVLEAAGAKTADIVLALTEVDEINLMVCMMAKNLGTRYSAARVYKPELSSDEEYLKNEFCIDYLLNPKMETANEMIRQIGLPGLVKADAFFSNDNAIIQLTVCEGLFQKPEMSVYEIRKSLAVEMLIVAVTREDSILIPDGNFTICVGDKLDIIASQDEIHKLVFRLGLVKKDAKNIFLIGGGDLSYYLAAKLLSERKKVTIIDSSYTRCEDLLAKLPEAKICYADGLQAECLLEEGIKKADVSLSLTGSDENNVIISLFAWSLGISSIITRINNANYAKLLNRVNIDITVSPSVITEESMLGFVRNIAAYNEAGNDIQSIHRIANGQAEAVEFVAYKSCPCLNIPFKSKEFKLKKNLLIAMIMRNDTCIIPNGDSVIQENDRVVVIVGSKQNAICNTLSDIFS